MKKFIKILMSIITLGFTTYQEYKAKQKEIDSLIVSTQQVLKIINEIRGDIKSGDMKISEVFRQLDIQDVKKLLVEVQNKYGTAVEITERIKFLYDTKVIDVIEEIKS